MSTHHERVNARVDKRKHPDGRTHVPDAGPHTEHCTRMVVRLQCRAALALCNDNQRVNHLVFSSFGQQVRFCQDPAAPFKKLTKFTEVKDPAPESQALVPESADIGGIRKTTQPKDCLRVLRLPCIVFRVEVYCIAEPTGSTHLAERVERAGDTILFNRTCERYVERTNHCSTCNTRVEGQQDVVQDGKDVESARLANRPRSIFPPPVDRIDGGYKRHVSRGKRDGNHGRQDALVRRLINIKRIGIGETIAFGRQCQRLRTWRKSEEGARWSCQLHKGCRHSVARLHLVSRANLNFKR